MRIKVRDLILFRSCSGTVRALGLAFYIVCIFLVSNLDARNVKLERTRIQRSFEEYKQRLPSSNILLSEEYELISFFRNSQTFQYKDNSLKKLLLRALENHERISDAILVHALEAVHALYPYDFHAYAEEIARSTASKRIMILSLLLIDKKNPLKANEIFYEACEAHFENCTADPLFTAFIKRNQHPPSVPLPKIVELLKFLEQRNQHAPYILVLLPENRNKEGIIVIHDGKTLLKDETGGLFYTKTLGRSIAGLPYFINDGHTPQGLFSIQKIRVSDHPDIGPTPAIVMGLPFEVEAKDFFHNPEFSSDFDREYQTFFPDYLKHIQHESYLAGHAGRSLIFIHGSVLSSSHYKKSLYYPAIPTQGCLSVKEKWTQDYKKIASDQDRLLEKVTEENKGFVYVIEVDASGASEIIYFLRNL